MQKDELVLNNLPLIYKCIKDMHCFWKTEDEFQDLYDMGLEGLVRGSKVYDESKGKPSTFLYTCIKNNITRYFYTSDLHKRKINKETMVSLDKYINNDTETTFLEMIEDPNVNIEDDVLKQLEVEKLMNAINKALTEQQARFICKQYGLDGYKPMTCEAIAAEEGCTRENVRFKNSNSIKRLKKYLKKNKGDVFMEELKKRKRNYAYETHNGVKKCINCNKTKPLEEFNLKVKNGKQTKPFCIECEKEHELMFDPSKTKCKYKNSKVLEINDNDLPFILESPVEVKPVEVKPVELGNFTYINKEGSTCIVSNETKDNKSFKHKVNNKLNQLKQEIEIKNYEVINLETKISTLEWVLDELEKEEI